MANTSSVNFDHLSARIEQGQRKAVIRTIGLSVLTVAVAAIFLVFTLREIEDARQQLSTVNSQISAANAAKQSAQAALKTAQDALKSAEARATMLTQQVSTLDAKLSGAQKALADSQKALAEIEESPRRGVGPRQIRLQAQLGRDEDDVRRVWVSRPILEVVANLKERVHWGMSNTQAGGYNSPGFATLVMQQLHKLPADGNLSSLPHDNGAPNIGDIVVYESGYHLFYFRDHERREFVVGMTPFGVTALNYDFGSKRVGIIHTGFGQR